MKKLFLIVNLLLVGLNVIYFISKNDDFNSIHSVSDSFAENEVLASGSGEEILSVGYATIPVEKNMDDLKEIYPNLAIVGDFKTGRMELIEKVLLRMPADKMQNFRLLQINQEKGASRGLGSMNTVIINDYELSDEEFVSVLVHEIGHVVDLGGIQGTPLAEKSVFRDGGNPIFENDFSTIYYAYSWIDNYEHINATDRLDFVTGYAMTDPFEDFAESFVYYVLHNQEFKMMAKENQKLELKYAYIRDYIFDGVELETGEGNSNVQRRVWDSTKLAIQI